MQQGPVYFVDLRAAILIELNVSKHRADPSLFRCWRLIVHFSIYKHTDILSCFRCFLELLENLKPLLNISHNLFNIVNHLSVD